MPVIHGRTAVAKVIYLNKYTRDGVGIQVGALQFPWNQLATMSTPNFPYNPLNTKYNLVQNILTPSLRASQGSFGQA